MTPLTSPSLPRPAVILGWVGALAIVLLSLSLWHERHLPLRPNPDAVHDTVLKIVAAQAETTFVHDAKAAAVARDSLHRLRDSVLAHPTDTVRVKEFVAQTDRTITKDSAALEAATVTIADLKAVVAGQDTTIEKLRHPIPPPRLTGGVAGLYDVKNGSALASGTIQLRVIGNYSLIARLDQPLAVRLPSALVGVNRSW